MHNALYPHPVDDRCPYCGSEKIENVMDEFCYTAQQCERQVDCRDCGKSHYLKYRLSQITLEDDADLPNLVDFHVGSLLGDQGVDDPDKAPKVLAAAVQTDEAIYLMAESYGDGASSYGYGCPVIIELYEGALRVIPWDDISKDDCGEIISLEGAKFEYDKPNEHMRYGLRLMTPDGTMIEQRFFDTPFGAAKGYARQMTVPLGHYVVCVDRMDNFKTVWDGREDA
jgi:hypothetical protein